jgi:hypothetical protein
MPIPSRNGQSCGGVCPQNLLMLHNANWMSKMVSISLWLFLACLTNLVGMSRNIIDKEKGEAFVLERLPKWEYCLQRLPNELGKMEVQFPRFGGSEYWHFEGHFLWIAKESPNNTLISFDNPKYRAAIRLGKDRKNLVDFGKRVDYGYAITMFEGISTIRNRNKIIPRMIRDGSLDIIDYSHRGTAHKLVFKERESDTKLELEFDDRYDSLPCLLQIFSEDGDSRVEYLDFVETKGHWLPTKCKNTVVFEGKKIQEIELVFKYFPNEVLDKQRCYLEYYDLAEPNFQVAEFGHRRRIWTYVLPTVFLVALIVAAFVWRRRSSK